MDSLDNSSTKLLCPMVRSKDQMDLDTYFEFSKVKKIRDFTLRKVHHLFPIYKTLDWFHKTKISNSCGVCWQETNDDSVTDLWCFGCRSTYHKECAEFPTQIKVPYHPKHPLQRHSRYCSETPLEGGSYYNKCNCCGEDTKGFYYSCSICDFNMHPVCAIKPNILSINNTKRHHHPLTYFPRKNSLTCDVCALGDDKSFIYICSQCDFFVHKSCIDLPTTIKISRHNHRLSFTPCLSLPNKDWYYCGVCRKRVDGNYGEYSCVKRCNYVVHSKCATRGDFWDGKELEGEPEIEYENIKTFEEIDDGIIKHFSHSNHYMKLEKKENDLVDGEKRCQACIIPIYEGGLYNCIKCDFTLHEKCALLPGRLWHQLHAHPLTLKVDHKGKFECTACKNACFGFAFVCCEARCLFNLDVRCALVSEPFVHGLHPHPLFLTFVQEKLSRCSVCGMTRRHLTCIECRFFLCFRCATIPYKVKYRHDEHFLTFSYNECDIPNLSCEICEGGTYTISIGFYTCNVCNVNVHKECLLGEDPFMKQGESIVINEVTLFIIPNDRLTRPICKNCEIHIPYKIAFTTIFGILFCSISCINGFGEERLFDLYRRWRKKDKSDLSSMISASSSAVRRATRKIQEGIQEGIQEAEMLLEIFPHLYKSK